MGPADRPADHPAGGSIPTRGNRIPEEPTAPAVTPPSHASPRTAPNPGSDSQPTPSLQTGHRQGL